MGFPTSKGRIQWGRVIFAAIFALLFVEAVLAFEHKLTLQHQIGLRLEKAQVELDRLQKEKFNLKKEKEALHSPEKIEQLAREKLGLTKPREIAIKVIKNETSQAPKIQENNNSSKKLWKKLKEEMPLKWLLKQGRS